MARPKASTRTLLPLIIGIGALTITAITAGYVAWRAEEREADFFQQAASSAKLQIESRIEDSIGVLRGVRGHFDAESLAVTQDNFQEYVAALELHQHHPEIRAIAYLPRVAAADRDEFVAGLAPSHPGFTIWPAQEAVDQFPVLFFHPDDARNQAALGFDLASDPIRRQAMTQARDTGEACVTGSVRLVQGGENESPTGFLIVLPMYQDGTDPGEILARQERLTGFVCSVFRIDELVEAACPQPTESPLRIQLFAGRVSGAAVDSRSDSHTLFYDSLGIENTPEISRLRPAKSDVIKVADQQWLVQMSSSHLSEAPEWVRAAVAVMVSGLAVSGLLVWITLQLTKSERFVHLQVSELTMSRQTLDEQQVRLRTITDAVPVLISYIDRDGRYRFVNRQYEIWFGHERKDIEGRRMADVMGEEAYRELKPFVDQALAGQEVKFNRWVPYAGPGLKCIEARYLPHVDAANQVQGFYVLVLDITERQRAQEVIVNSEERYRLAARATRDAIWDWDLRTGRTSWSEALREQFGYAETETSAEWWRERLHPDDRERVVKDIHDVVDGKHDRWQAEYLFLRADGSVAQVLDRGYVVRGEDGRAVRMLGAMIDQSERNQTERMMRRMVQCAQATSHEFFEDAVRAVAELTGFRYCFVAETLEDRPGHVRVIASWMDGQPGDHRAFALSGTAGEQVMRENTLFIGAAASAAFPNDRWLSDLGIQSYLGTPLHDSNGVTMGLLVAMHDQPKADDPHHRTVLELLAGRAGPELQRERVADQLAASSREVSQRLAELEAWFQTIPIGLAIADDPECRAIRTNPALADLLGLKTADNASKSGPLAERLPFMILRDGHEVPSDQLPMQQCAKLGIALPPEELDVWRSDGQVFRFMVYTTPLFDEFNRVRGCLSAHVDITERNRAEQRLIDSRQRFRQLADAMPQVVWTAKPDGSIEYLNQRAIELMGHSPNHASDLAWIEYVHSEDRQEAEARWSHSVATGEAFQVECRLGRRDDAQARWHLGRAVPVTDSAGRIVRWYGTCTDIEDQKRIQEALQQSQEQYRASFELASVGKAQTNPATGRFERVNRKLCEITGYTETELLEKTFAEITVPEDREHDLREFDRMVRGETTGYAVEKRYRRQDGTMAWVQASTALVRDLNDRPLHTIAVIQDVTSRKNAELELDNHRQRLEELVTERTQALEESHERLRLSERMASIGSLAAGLGHDMGNLVLPVMCRLETLATMELPPAAREEIVAVQTTMTYLRQLSAGLRLFALDAQDSGASSVQADLESWWPEVRNLLSKAVPKGVRVEADFEAGLPRVAIGPHQLTQAVLNLVVNAGDAIIGAGMKPADGCVTIWAETVGDGSHLDLGVTDNGPGMSAAVRRHATDPFFTTKKRGLSTGLGLSLVHNVIQAVHGEIDLQSEPGEGTTITMRLPTVKEHPSTIDTTGQMARVALKDPRVASYTTSLLRTSGFDVHSNGASALGSESLVVTEPGMYEVDALTHFLRGGHGRKVILVNRNGDDLGPVREPGLVTIDGSHRSMHEALRLAVTEA